MPMPGHFRFWSPTWTKINNGRNVNQSEDAIYCVTTTILNLTSTYFRRNLGFFFSGVTWIDYGNWFSLERVWQRQLSMVTWDLLGWYVVRMRNEMTTPLDGAGVTYISLAFSMFSLLCLQVIKAESRKLETAKSGIHWGGMQNSGSEIRNPQHRIQSQDYLGPRLGLSTSYLSVTFQAIFSRFSSNVF